VNSYTKDGVSNRLPTLLWISYWEVEFMEEKWLDAFIKNTNCTYEVSNTGKVRNKATKYELKQFDNGQGYKTVAIWVENNTKRKKFYVHRLIALSFIKNIENKRYVNHKDGNKSNNNAENLEWCTCSETQKHKYRVLKCKYPKRKIFSKAIKIKCLETGEIYKSVRGAARILNIDARLISRSIHSNGRYTANNCHWTKI